jgi:hypothetical protein
MGSNWCSRIVREPVRLLKRKVVTRTCGEMKRRIKLRRQSKRGKLNKLRNERERGAT